MNTQPTGNHNGSASLRPEANPEPDHVISPWAQTTVDPEEEPCRPGLSELIERLIDEGWDAWKTERKDVWVDKKGTPFTIWAKWDDELQRYVGHRHFLDAKNARKCQYPSAPTRAEILEHGSVPTSWGELHRGDPL
jgi:hypothetical protein